MITEYQTKLDEKFDEAADLHETKEKMQKDFQAQLLKVGEEFKELTK